MGNDTFDKSDLKSKPKPNPNAKRNYDSLNFDKVIKDLEPPTNPIPWYKKQGSIITMSSTLGSSILIAGIAVPVILISKNVHQIIIELIEAKAVYDLSTKSIKLVVMGKNLPNQSSLYSALRFVSPNFEPISSGNVHFNWISDSEVNFNFTDSIFTIYSVYKIRLENGPGGPLEISTIAKDNIPQPILSITNQPLDQTILTSSPTMTASLMVSAHVSSLIDNEVISYEWKISDENTADETKWSIISKAITPTFVYDAKDLPINVKKYFKCTISYKYAKSITSKSVYIEKVNPPVITISTQPTNVNLSLSETTATLSVSATVTLQQVVTYQWQSSLTENGTFTPIEGANSNTYVLSNVTYGFKQYYKCVVSSLNAKPVSSSVAYISRVFQPVITISAQPSNVNLAFTDTIGTLTVRANVANGASGQTLSYQWHMSDAENGTFTQINGATSPSYSYTDVATMAPDSKKYFKCVISSPNAVSITSNTVYIKRALQPTINISAQPVSVNLTLDQSEATLTVNASTTNQQALTYQWQRSTNENGPFTPIANANSNTYRLSNIRYGFKEYYKCIISSPNIITVETSVAFIAKVAQPIITISSHPTDVNLAFTDTTASLSVTAAITNQQALSYQWQSSSNQTTGFVDISGANLATYTLNSNDVAALVPGTKKYYKCIVSSPNAERVTSNAAFIIRALQPVITFTTQPNNVDLSAAQTSATLTANATIANGVNGQSISYKWQSSNSQNADFADINGANSNSYVLSNVDYGFRKYYRCIATSANASQVISQVVYIARATRPVISISTQPIDVNLAFADTTASLSVVASLEHGASGQGLTYQWQSSAHQTTGFANMSGQTSSTYTLNDVSGIPPGGKKYYKCIVSSANAEPVHSRVAFIERASQTFPSVTITSHPASQTLTSASNNFSLSVVATVTNPVSGRPTPTYQWFSSDSQTGPYLPISNATSSTFTKNLDSNKNSLKDTWYKCEVTYTGATTPTVSSTPALVKMTLTEAEAKTELIKWFGEQNNFDPILRSYFNETNSTNNRQAFYSSLHIREFINVPTSVEVVSITPEQLSIQGAATFTSYKIKIKTNSTASYRNRTAGGTAPEEWLPIGTFIEFNTLFSFLGDSSAVKNVHGAPNYNMSLTTSFSFSGNKNVTTISWTTNPNDVPGISNALRSNAYPVRVTNSNGGVIFTDSLVSSALPSFSSTYNPTIPTYNIRR